jgi:hypothetical protein
MIDHIYEYVAGSAIAFDRNRGVIERMATLLFVQKCTLARSSI